MVAPEPGAWSFTAGLTGTSLHIEHIESDDPGLVTPYWHVQRLLIGELSVSAARGLAPGVGVSFTLPVRIVRDRIRFEDLARRPYAPPEPDTHHRNETLTQVADPQMAALFSRQAGRWTLGASVGTSFPVGRTESNPFVLGRLGLPHQHIQFGTGSWDPLVNAAATRAVGGNTVSAAGSARLPLYENSHGFRAGNRFGLVLGASRSLGALWAASAALSLDREEAEKWSGRIEEEGNLGRTDLFARIGAGRTIADLGSLSASVQLPLRTWATGEQVKFPVIVSLSWSR